MLARLLSCLLPARHADTPASDAKELVQLATIAGFFLAILSLAKWLCPFCNG